MSMQEHYDQNTNQKLRAKKGHYRLNSLAIFRPKIYRLRSNVEGVFSVIKRLFNGTKQKQNLYNQPYKETKLKNTIIQHLQINTNQPKMRVSTKPYKK